MAGVDVGVTPHADATSHGDASLHQGAPLSLGTTLRLFVRLKLRLIAGNLRGDLTRQLGFALTLAAAVALAAVGFFLMTLLRLAPAGIAGDIGIIAFTVFFLGWALIPLLVFGLDDTLDPATLSLLPLRTRQIAVGLFATSATGPWPITTLVITAGAIAGLATGLGGVLLGVVAVALQFAVCLVTSRLITTSLSGVRRSRRGGDLLAVTMILIIFLLQLAILFLTRGLIGDREAMLRDTAAILRWTPPGMAAHAIADGGATAVAELVFLGALSFLLGWLWIVALRRALVSADASTQAPIVRRSRGGVARFLPDGQLAAVVSKELKYARRDPRSRVGWCVSMTSSTMMLAVSLTGRNDGSGLMVALPPACLGALMIGLESSNTFGIDGPSLWMKSVVYGSEHSLRTDVAGRHLAVSLIAAPLLAVLSIVAAFLAGDLLLSLPAVFTAWGVLGVSLGVGAVTSVVFPYAKPERLSAFTGAAPGQGAFSFFGCFGEMIGTGLLAIPVMLPVFLGLTWLSVVAVPYGMLVAWTGRRIAGKIGFARFPELLAAVTRTT